MLLCGAIMPLQQHAQIACSLEAMAGYDACEDAVSCCHALAAACISCNTEAVAGYDACEDAVSCCQALAAACVLLAVLRLWLGILRVRMLCGAVPRLHTNVPAAHLSADACWPQVFTSRVYPRGDSELPH